MSPELNVCTPPAATSAGVDFDAIKQRQQATWASGNYAIIGTALQIVGESLAEAAALRAAADSRFPAKQCLGKPAVRGPAL